MSFLYEHQKEAVDKMFNGCVLNGGTGSGKSRTGLYYYFKEQGGYIDDENYISMKKPKDLYIITIAKKRDDLEWEDEMAPYLLSTNSDANFYDNKVVVDSWQNIKKYIDVKNAFFIFDEEKICGTGAWAKAFLKITRNNDWIMLSATVGDNWQDYETLFIANGFFKNRSEMRREHYVYNRFTKYPKVDRYINEGRLIRLRNHILIPMDFERHTIQHHETVYCKYDSNTYKDLFRFRWNIYTDEPMTTPAELCYCARKLVNSDESRQVALLELAEQYPRMIVFYSHDYEREILLSLYYGEGFEVAEYNGHKHEPIPDSSKWIYIVNYSSGAEGFNCTKTNCIVFYSQTYSYKTLKQACGRIDRLNTGYRDLYYYHLKSRAGIDLAISSALNKKKKFNEGKFVKW